MYACVRCVLYVCTMRVVRLYVRPLCHPHTPAQTYTHVAQYTLSDPYLPLLYIHIPLDKHHIWWGGIYGGVPLVGNPLNDTGVVFMLLGEICIHLETYQQNIKGTPNFKTTTVIKVCKLT